MWVCWHWAWAATVSPGHPPSPGGLLFSQLQGPFMPSSRVTAGSTPKAPEVCEDEGSPPAVLPFTQPPRAASAQQSRELLYWIGEQSWSPESAKRLGFLDERCVRVRAEASGMSVIFLLSSCPGARCLGRILGLQRRGSRVLLQGHTPLPPQCPCVV